MRYIIDPFLTEIFPGNVPKDWGVRAIFRSTESSKIWLERVKKDEAPENFPKLIKSYKDLLSKVPVCRTFVSFGPGGSSLDLILLESFKIRQNLRYIPIDISPLLLKNACDIIGNRFDIPLCIEGDFEGGLEFIGLVLKKYCRPPVVFSILGNAVGNADNNERSLIGGICNLMPKDQMLLISVATGKFEEKHITDPSKMAAWDSIKRLIAGGIAMISGEDYAKVFKSLDGRLHLMVERDEVIKSTCMRFYDNLLNRVVFSSKRYDLHNFKSWIEQTQPLKLIDYRNALYPKSDVGIGCFLFSKL